LGHSFKAALNETDLRPFIELRALDVEVSERSEDLVMVLKSG
jgi:hypothetical protein